ncbi:hypothetical protein HHI36_002525 [Cryptolaemus montrouzieri]|uniref:Maturase K n=1 Tax=Cryptolaemus montrouzieri TaxID=559131 RepID=A0ABD2PAW4_9CUCU
MHEDGNWRIVPGVLWARYIQVFFCQGPENISCLSPLNFINALREGEFFILLENIVSYYAYFKSDLVDPHSSRELKASSILFEGRDRVNSFFLFNSGGISTLERVDDRKETPL